MWKSGHIWEVATQSQLASVSPWSEDTGCITKLTKGFILEGPKAEGETVQIEDMCDPGQAA